jgi:hypothetical protein
MSVARLRLAPVGETFLAGETMFPPRAPFFEKIGAAPPAQRPKVGP